MQNAQQQQLVEDQYKQEAAQTVENVLGTTGLEGTGYTNFQDLVTAKRKKQQQLDEDRKSRAASNFASLLGKGTTLG